MISMEMGFVVTSAGMIKVAEPVLGMFFATTTPSLGWTLSPCWSLMVMVLLN